MDSGNKACENKGMCFKMPRKKHPFQCLAGLLLVSLLSMVSIAHAADDDQNVDRALFWSIEKNGLPAGHILGTIHSEDPRVLDFRESFLEKLRANEVFAMELVPDMHMLERLNGYMHYPPGQNLEPVIGIESYRALLAALSAYQVPAEVVNRMKPWAAMMTLSTPPPETGFFMDLSLSLRAAGNGLEVIGLETLEQQISFLENMPLPMQLSLLNQAIVESENVNEVHDQMVDAYLENDLEVLQNLSDEQLQLVGESAANYFIESGINARNHRMADSLFHQLENQTVFVAVGALHLPGQNGLLNILRQHGYTLKPLPTPLPGPSVIEP